jgi:metal-responsive CopG/Arc/MetJ family transcriptional regulator
VKQSREVHIRLPLALLLRVDAAAKAHDPDELDGLDGRGRRSSLIRRALVRYLEQLETPRPRGRGNYTAKPRRRAQGQA